ncbi:MAG: Gmad2 immunoglobulin-like domain-containing protein [Chloroflexota bacterium]|nr:Gmad2 immunoglobulin-like domain-containing protein [Chloroflexota bacterium]
MDEKDREEGMLGEEETTGPAAEDAAQDVEMMDPVEDDLQDDEASAEKQDRSPWILAGLGGLVVILIFAILAALGVFEKEQPVVEDPDMWIIITEPAQGTVLGVPDAVVVKGQGHGLFENNVVVQAMDSEGNVLSEQATVTDAAEPGGTGNWSVEIVIPVKPGSEGLIFAFSTSPQDGSITASASVEVTYGADAEIESKIEITEPKKDQVLDISAPITVRGTGQGLFEGNVVVEAVDGDGNVLVQEAAVMSSDEPGGAGEWSVDLDVHSDAVINGTIRAYSPSPADGSIMAESIVAVTFGEEDEPQPDTSLKLEDALWALATLHGTDVISDTEIRAEFKDGQIAGSAGCNEYFASYERTDESITFGDAGSTRMMCNEPEGIMDQESQYLGSLETVESFRYAQGGLQMMDASATVVLFYRPIVAGTVSYQQMSVLPPDAVLTVQLQDVSNADAPATVIGETIVTEFEFDGIPIPFAVSYDPEAIDTRNTYALSVRITDGAGNLLFTNTTSYQVITQGNPSEVEVIVDPV